jgi:transcriptional regulator with XRE-family HTH domain
MMGAECRRSISSTPPTNTTTNRAKAYQTKKAESELGGTITQAKRGERATRVVRHGSDSPTLQPPKPLTYENLKEYHKGRIRLDKEGRERSNSVLKNHQSVINSWVKFQLAKKGEPYSDDASSRLPLGEEITTNFISELAAYLENLKAREKKKSTLNDRKSIMWSVFESAGELIRASGLPGDFAGALESLVQNSGVMQARISSAAGLSRGQLRNWMRGADMPDFVSLPKIQKLEDFFQVQRGTLSGRLPHFNAPYTPHPPRTGTTPWRAHSREVQKFQYSLRELPPVLASECKDLLLFKTDDVWLEQRDLKRALEWRIRVNRGSSPSAGKFFDDVRKFMGWLRLPADEKHPWARGQGFAEESLSLALLSDADLVFSFLEFWRERAYLQSFNSGTVAFVVQCLSLIKEETGFLRQQPSYANKLPKPVPPRRWDKWCETNYIRLARFLKKIRKSKNRPLRKTRDPFAAVRCFIEERQHPISALWEMTANMKRVIPLKANDGPFTFALHMRDIALGEFEASYPLRVENVSLMTWIPKNPADLLDPRRAYVETKEESNLYQKPDGIWWIRFPPEEMKNAKGVDVPVAQSVVGSLVEYLFKHRPVLNQGIKESIKRRRASQNLPPLTPEEERAIDNCPYIFRPCPTHVQLMKPSNFAAYKGVGQMTIGSLSLAMFVMSQRYIPNCKGFRLHAVRHIVASEYIKNYPNGFAVAAAALNITEEVVRRHYAWVRACDQIKPWQDYHENLREQFESGVCLS